MLSRIAVQLKALNVYAHHAHNNCRGKTFFADHDFLGSTYDTADSDYDAVVERLIGTSAEAVDTISLHTEAVKLVSSLQKSPGDSNSNFFRVILNLEMSLCILIDKCIESKKYPEGTNQLIGDIADRSMSRQYKVRQRLQG
jgi:DNA-binding ferritin-like protein